MQNDVSLGKLTLPTGTVHNLLKNWCVFVPFFALVSFCEKLDLKTWTVH